MRGSVGNSGPASWTTALGTVSLSNLVGASIFPAYIPG